MVVDDLKQECRLRQLPTSGTKAILITRLREAVAQDESISTERLVCSEVEMCVCMYSRVCVHMCVCVCEREKLSWKSELAALC